MFNMIDIQKIFAKVFGDEIFKNGVLVKREDLVVYTSHEGYDQIIGETIKQWLEDGKTNTKS